MLIFICPFLGRPEEWPYACMIVCLSVCLCVIILVYTFLHFGIHFFIGLYLFNTATDHVHFWHACTLGPGLYSPNVFGDAALINYANLCKICQSVNILVYTFLHFGIHFFFLFCCCIYWFQRLQYSVQQISDKSGLVYTFLHFGIWVIPWKCLPWAKFEKSYWYPTSSCYQISITDILGCQTQIFLFCRFLTKNHDFNRGKNQERIN